MVDTEVVVKKQCNFNQGTTTFALMYAMDWLAQFTLEN